VAEPEKGLLRAGFRIWFRHVVPFIGSLVSDRAAYHYLPRSTAYLPRSEQIVAMLNDSGFSAVNHRRVMGGLSQQFIATRSVCCSSAEQFLLWFLHNCAPWVPVRVGCLIRPTCCAWDSVARPSRWTSPTD
jgi:hypothetical protein